MLQRNDARTFSTGRGRLAINRNQLLTGIPVPRELLFETLEHGIDFGSTIFQKLAKKIFGP